MYIKKYMHKKKIKQQLNTKWKLESKLIDIVVISNFLSNNPKFQIKFQSFKIFTKWKRKERAMVRTIV